MESRAPPPTAEEETVKEVLSETPATPKLAAVSIFPEPELHRLTKKRVSESVAESEDVSEVCSLSESASAATDELGVQHHYQRSANRSPAKAHSFRSHTGAADLGTRRELVRRSEMSPGRRNGGSVRIVQSKQPSQPQSVPRRRDPGESSGRRSRSPATRIENAGQGVTRQGVSRSPSARRTNPSPGRARADPSGHGGKKNIKNPSNTGNGDESLENPLVSLECFIFL